MRTDEARMYGNASGVRLTAERGFVSSTKENNKKENAEEGVEQV